MNPEQTYGAAGTKAVAAAAAVVMALLVAGCATTEASPYCSDRSAANPLPTESCLGKPSTAGLRERLDELILPHTEETQFRVSFDSDSRIGEVCAERGPGARTWSDRIRIGDQMAEISRLPAGDPCLADTRLEFGRQEALVAEIELLAQDCTRQSPTPRHYRLCIARLQRTRNEMWVRTGVQRRALIFEATEDADTRRHTMRACANLNYVVGQSPLDEQVPRARDAEALVECMHRHGWLFAQ